MFDLAISLLMLSAIVLVSGAVVLWRRGNARKATLMAVLAVVMVVNVVIWLAPTSSGVSLADVAQEDEAAGR
ncbi:MAG: hypothetical protein KDE15_06175 [Erythrobacter sp.]|nr:hypothetical protein [Erythrobacter sp.]